MRADLTALPYDRLPAATDLFARYVSGDPDVTRLYAHPPTVEAVREAARIASRRDVPRQSVAGVLRVQAERWGVLGAERAAALDRLGQPHTVAVVTGQQVGVLGGPLYTLYKAATAVRLARELERSGQPAVAVFWLHGEDHDVDEVAQVGVATDGGARTLRLAVPPPPGSAYGPAGLLPADGVPDLLAEVARLLPGADLHRSETLDLLRRCYAGGTLTDGLARLLDALLPGSGLILLDAADPSLKPHLAGLFAADVARGPELAEAVARQTERVVAAGGAAQIHVTPTNLFYLSAGGRLPVDQQAPDRFALRGSDARWTRAELTAEIAERPERFSPNVALRPLAQDVLLPTAAYVAGPGEAAYYAQLTPTYALHGLPMPVVFPRASLTLVPPAARRLMERHDLSLPDLQRVDAERALHRLAARRLPPATADAFRTARQGMETALDGLSTAAADLHLEPTLAATRVRMARELDRLHLRAVRAARRQATELEAAYLRARALVAPGGQPQERVVSAVAVLSAQGTDAFADLPARLPLEPHAHLVADVR